MSLRPNLIAAFSPGRRALLPHPAETQFNTKRCTPRACTRPGESCPSNSSCFVPSRWSAVVLWNLGWWGGAHGSGGWSAWCVQTDEAGERVGAFMCHCQVEKHPVWLQCLCVSAFVSFMHAEKNGANQQILIWFVTPSESGLDHIHSVAIFLWHYAQVGKLKCRKLSYRCVRGRNLYKRSKSDKSLSYHHIATDQQVKRWWTVKM